jgi:hypothetical protein
MRRFGILVAAVTLVAVGCGWTQPEFDAGRSRGNDFETGLTVANAASLVTHTIPPATPGTPVKLAAILGSQIVTQQGSSVVAYDTGTCPKADNTACAPLWTVTNRRFLGSDGSSVMVFAGGASDVEVTDLARNHLFDAEVTVFDTSLSHAVNSFAIWGDRFAVDAAQGSHGSTDTTINVFDRRGCGAATCGALQTFTSFEAGINWRLTDNTMLMETFMPERNMTAYDATTGALRWTVPGGYNFVDGIRIRGNRVFAQRDVPSPLTDVFALDGSTGCAGVPKTCSPLRQMSTPSQFGFGSAASNQRYVSTAAVPIPNTNTATRSFAFFSTDGTGCTATPCAPLATTKPVTTFYATNWMIATVTANLVFGVDQPTGFGPVNYHVLAYDAALNAGCSGSPKVCAPVADISIPSLIGTPDTLVVVNGRVYLSGTQDGGVHVLSLPGDVG